MSTDAELRTLRAAIEDAFGSLPYPGARALGRNQTQRHLEQEEIIEDFGSGHWRDLPHHIMSYQNAALSFLSPKGFQYYLPAYMLSSLPNPDEDSESTAHLSEKRKRKRRWKAKEREPTCSHHVLSSLGPIGDSGTEKFLERVGLLTVRQKAAVRLYVSYERKQDHNEEDEYPAFDPDGYWAS